jgi:hypothetical protein
MGGRNHFRSDSFHLVARVNPHKVLPAGYAPISIGLFSGLTFRGRQSMLRSFAHFSAVTALAPSVAPIGAQ